MVNRVLVEKIKSFGMTNQMIAEDISAIERRYDIELGHLRKQSEFVESDYYPQLDAAVRAEGAMMARHYEVFYSLERSIRALVRESFVADLKRDDWWDTSKVPQAIKDEVAKRIQKELDAGVSRRSQEALDYTTFGELSDIINSNWALFGSLFNSRKGLEKVFASSMLSGILLRIAARLPKMRSFACELQCVIGFG